MSRHDNLLPGVFMEDEAALWAGTTPTIQVLQGLGPRLQPALGREESWRGIHEWLRAHVVSN